MLTATIAGAVLLFSAAPAAAQPTTPLPQPSDPNQPPMSAPVGTPPPGRAVGDAGTGLTLVRILPNSAPTKTISPGAEDKLPKQPQVEVGLGLASAQANSEAYLAQERSIAQASPGSVAVQGSSPTSPGAVAQTAMPDNAEPATGGVALPETPLSALISGGLLNGRAHARWSETLGPCVDPISDASIEVASLSLLNAIPTLPSESDLTGVFDAPKLDAQADRELIDRLNRLAGPLSTLGGVLSGGTGTGSLVSVPDTLAARSVVRLVDIPGSKNKAVQSTSTLQAAKITLLAGTPFEIVLKVSSQPTLTVTSTGDAKTSTVAYTAPVLEVIQGGRSLGRLDARNPTMDVPIAVPLPGADLPGARDLPIIGELLANGQRVSDSLRKLDLGVLRLSVAQLNERSLQMTDPFRGYQLGASARLLDVQLLPTDALGLPNLPSALAQVSIGEQIARAYAPAGGVVCSAGMAAPPPQPEPEPQGKQRELAYTTLAYKTIPMFWTGTAMLLIGVVLLAASPVSRGGGR